MVKSIVNGAEHDIVRIPMKGKNLARYWKAAYVAASGTVNANRLDGMSFPVKIEAGQTVCFTNQKTNFGRGIAAFSGFDGETLTDMVYRSTNNTVTYTADRDCYVIIWGNYDNTTSMDESVFALCGQMLNLGSAALPYEPYGYQEGWEVRDNQDRLIWGREDELQTATGTLPFKGYGLPAKVKSLLGNTQQTGTPMPDNPIMPEFVGVRTGILFDIKDGTKTINNVVWTAYHGSITAQGTTTSPSESDSVIVYDGTFTKSGNYINYCKIQASKSIKPPAGTYTFSANANPSNNNRIALIVGDDGSYFSNSSARKIAVGETFSVNGNEYVMLVVSSYVDLDQYVFSDIMLNTGSTALPYEPYGYKIPITCAGQTVPVYLGQTPTVRRIKKRVFDGTENWTLWIYQTAVMFYTPVADGTELLIVSSHFGTRKTGSMPLTGNVAYNGNSNKNMLFRMLDDTTITTVEGFKEWLAAQYAAGTPVTVWYILAEPTTGIVNEPLAKIGDYADELNGIVATLPEIPTTTGQNTLIVDATLAPSQMMVKGHIKLLS